MILVLVAFISGILTVFSPCVLPILPIVLASGVDGSIQRIRGMIVGLVLSFTAAALLLATVVRTLGIPADTVRLFAVVLLIIFGLSLIFHQVWVRVQTWIETHWHFQPTQSKNPGFWGGFSTGVSLGIVWTPCIGPVLASVATLAAVGSFSFLAFLIAFSYALGTALPLYFIAKGGTAASQRLGFVKTYNQNIRQVFGLVVLATALMIYSGADRALQAWTLENLPESWTLVTTFFEESLVSDQELRVLEK